MAMEEWVPMRLDIAIDPDVIRLSKMMKPAVRPEVVVGYLHSVWSWASKATDNGVITNVTLDDIEELLHLPQFLHFMERIGWVSEVIGVEGSAVTFEDWEVWNSESRKKRLKNAKRMENYRSRTKVQKMSQEKRTRCSCSCSSSSSSKSKKSSVFQKPTLEQVRAYCKERENSVDAESWMDHYESNGWKVGRNAMKDWRAAVRQWEKRQQAESTQRDITI